MKESERINELRNELSQLKRQLESQEKTLESLQEKIFQLGGSEAPVRKTIYARPSLENIIGLRLIHFIGIVVLVIGLSIGVKYAIDRDLVSEGMRIVLAYSAGLILFFLSFRLRKKYLVFSAILFSGAMASIYFTTYGAFVYYQMFSFGVAFALMIALTLFTVFQAISYDRQEIALLGLVGAYGIPFLISQNAERAELFFLYISLINVAVVFLSVRKAWKNVGRSAQIITWILFIGWASVRYQPKFQFLGLVFMVFFFLLFLTMVVAFKMLHKQRLTMNDTYQVILNNIAVYLAAVLIFADLSVNTDIAIISFIMCLVTSLQAYFSYNFWKDEPWTTRMISTMSLTLFVFFIGFNWDGFVVTILWLLTAVLVFLWGFRMRSVSARLVAILLIGVTLAKLIVFDSQRFSPIEKVIAYLVLGVLLLAGSFFYQKYRDRIFGGKE